MKQLTINRARALGKDMDAKGVVILAFGDDGEFQAASYGRTKHDCGLLGKWLDRIYEAIESGKIPDPFAGAAVSVDGDYGRAMRMVAEVDADPGKCSAETRCFASLVNAVDNYHRFHLANVNDYVCRLIGGERGLCRCCGRAHAIEHDDECPVPHLIHLTSGG